MPQQNAFLRWVNLTLVVLAGAWTLFHLAWNFAKQTSDDYWGIGLLILFVLALIVAFVQYFQERAALKAASATQRFPEPAISTFFLASEGSAALWFVVRMNVGAEWLLAGWDKITSPAWGASGKALSGFVAGAFAKTSGPNPAVQGWYAWFLQHIVQPGAGFSCVSPGVSAAGSASTAGCCRRSACPGSRAPGSARKNRVPPLPRHKRSRRGCFGNEAGRSAVRAVHASPAFSPSCGL